MQDLELLRRLLRAKDRMDAASQEEWPIRRLARVSGVSEAHFARSFKDAFGVPPIAISSRDGLSGQPLFSAAPTSRLPRSPFKPAGPALAPSGAPFGTSLAKARARS